MGCRPYLLGDRVLKPHDVRKKPSSLKQICLTASFCYIGRGTETSGSCRKMGRRFIKSLCVRITSPVSVLMVNTPFS